MIKKITLYLLIILLVLTLALYFKIFTNEKEEIKPEEITENIEEKKENDNLLITDLAIKDKKIYLLAKDKEENISLFSGNLNSEQIKLKKEKTSFELKDIKIGSSKDNLFLYDNKKIYILNEKFEEIERINIEKINSKVFRYKKTYNDKLFYLKKLNENKFSIIMNNLNLNKHLDLLEIKSNNITDFDISDDYSKIFYKSNNKSILHFLDQNKKQVLDNEKNVFRFNKNKLLSFEKEIVKNKVNFKEIDLKKEVSQSDKKDNNLDLVIKNGIVVDPDKETIKFGYNVGIKDDKISVITKDDLKGKKEIDAYKKIVSPGFIDMLSFNLNLKAARYKVADGVTTNLSMHGCSSDFTSFFKRYEKSPTLINYGGALYAVRLRFEQGLGLYSKPSKKQIQAMAQRADEEIKDGAIGIAFSPEYYPGTSSEEIKAIMKVGKKYNLKTHFHARYSSLTGEKTNIDGVKEVLSYAKKLNAPVHFMHLHSTGGTGVMKEALEMIKKARKNGFEVTYDIYPYDSWATNLSFSRFDGDWKSKFNIDYKDLQLAGTDKRLTEKDFNHYREVGGIVIAYALDEKELRLALKDSLSTIGSDATINNENNHHRGAGTFSRLIGRYIRDEDVLSFMDGLKKITILNAKHLEDVAPALAKRGRLQENMIADITIFDYENIIDKSSAKNPATESKGIDYVLVSGKIVKDLDGVNMDMKVGKPIKGIFK
ncbi:MAG: amidohydrolase family protein [Bacillota bacterium]